jgi:hypothetical protein
MPKRIRDIIMMKATHHRIIGKAILPGTSKASTMKFFSFMHETGIAKQKVRTTRITSSNEMPSDITYMDRTETS